jgi:hypothetical protein
VGFRVRHRAAPASPRRRVVAALVAAAAALPASAAAAPVRLLPIGSFAEPVDVAAPLGDTSRVFVVERAGRIQVVRGGASSVFVDLSGRVLADGTERGLFSIAFAPDFLSSGVFYVYYTARSPAGALTISALLASGDRADPSSERILVQIPHASYANHNGGQLQIGPDGALYAGTGDGGGAGDPFGNGQRLSGSPTAEGANPRLGKILRIDRTTGTVGLWSWGLRNPWRFAFDRATGDLVIADVGQNTWEEVDFAPEARAWGLWTNFGWSLFEGRHPPNPGATTFPVLEHSHSEGWCSITGGYVVRDPALPELAGRYVFSDFCKGDIMAATLGAAGASGEAQVGSLHVDSPSSFGEDGCGRVYVASLGGAVSRLASSGACAGPAPVFTASLAGLGGLGAGAGGALPRVRRDTRAPRLRLRYKRTQKALWRRYVAVRVGCDERCTVRARGVLVVRRRRARAAAAAPLRTARARATLARGARRTLRLRLSRRTRARAGRALRSGRRVVAVVSLVATDRAGNARHATARVRVVRR